MSLLSSRLKFSDDEKWYKASQETIIDFGYESASKQINIPTIKVISESINHPIHHRDHAVLKALS